MDNQITYVSKTFTERGIRVFFVCLLVLQVIYFNHTMPILLIVISSITTVCFFHYLTKITMKWNRYPEELFRKKLFKQAFIIRTVAVVFMYCLFYIIYGDPYEAGAADAYFYDSIGSFLSDQLKQGDFDIYGKLSYFLDISDMGYPFFLAFAYTLVFKSILLVRVINALLGAWTCLIIYDLARRNFTEQVARIAGIMMMLLPNLIYYCGLTLKETLMVCIVVNFINLGDKLFKAKRIKFKQVLLFSLLGEALFFFRTALGISMILAMFTCVIIVSQRVSTFTRRMFLGIWIFIAIAAIFSSPLGDSIRTLISQKDVNQDQQMQNFATRKNGNAFAKYGSMSVFLPMILVAPFPTLVDTGQYNQMFIAGAIFTRNIYAFFVIVALVTMYKKKLLRKYCVIVVPVSCYLLVIASSGFALSERFHMPAIPFLVILAAYGVTQMNKKTASYYGSYLIFVALIIIGWNWFKLAGRGM